MQPQHVEDVVQETFLGLAGILSKGRFDHDLGTPAALVGRIASNTCVDYYKRFHRIRFDDVGERIEENLGASRIEHGPTGPHHGKMANDRPRQGRVETS